MYLVRAWIDLNVPEEELLVESPSVDGFDCFDAQGLPWRCWNRHANLPAMASARDVLMGRHTWSIGRLDHIAWAPCLQHFGRDSDRREERRLGELDPGKIAVKLFERQSDVNGTSGDYLIAGQRYR